MGYFLQLIDRLVLSKIYRKALFFYRQHIPLNVPLNQKEIAGSRNKETILFTGRLGPF
jgi:hypothetical protein